MTNTSTIQQKILCLDYCQDYCQHRTELKKKLGQWRKLRQGDHAENLPAFSIWNEILLPLGTLTLTTALICKHLGKESSFMISKGFLVSYVLVLDDNIIQMGWVYIFSFILHRLVQCLLYYYIRKITTLYKSNNCV